MSDSTQEETPKSIYKRRNITQSRRELPQKLEKVMTPVPVVADLPVIEKKQGPEKSVVREWSQSKHKANILKYIKQGLSPKEAGILAGFAPEQMDSLIDRSDPFRRFVQKAMIEFKQKHLEVISEKKDPKLSQWVLENSFSDEFNKKPAAAGGGEEGSTTTVIQAIVKTVQATPDNPVPVEHQDVTNKHSKKESVNSSPERNRGPEPSLDSGGANII